MSKRAEAKLRKSQRVAHHEAGHAVAAMQSGVRLESVTIKPSDETNGAAFVRRGRIPKDPRRLLEIAKTDCFIRLAGPAAERRFSGRWDWMGAGHDLECVSGFAREIAGPDVREQAKFKDFFVRWAGHWVAIPEVWQTIEAVAEALLERETLTASEVKELLMVAS